MNNSKHFLLYRAQFFLEWEIVQIKVVEKIKAHFMLNNFFLNRALCEIMWKNIVEPGMPLTTI